jgi:hypothetical protein
MRFPVVGSVHTLQLSIAVCAGVAATTLTPSARRMIPRWFEAGLWIALIVLCWLGVTTVEDAKARELTGAIAWAGGQIVNTALGLVRAGFSDWISNHRFVVANWVVIVCGVDVLMLALLSSRRQGSGWQPRVKLRDWLELPPLEAPKPAAVPEDPFKELNRRCAAASGHAAAAMLTWAVHMTIWLRDVVLPREARRLARGIASVARADPRRGLQAGHMLYIRPYERPLPEDAAEHSDQLAS